MFPGIVCSPPVLPYADRMPESHPPVRNHPGKPAYTMGEAAGDRMLVVVKCNRCRRCIHYLASDLAEVLGTNWPALDPPLRCGKCKTAELMKITLRQIHAGDIGLLVVRRPGKPRVVRDWKDGLY